MSRPSSARSGHGRASPQREAETLAQLYRAGRLTELRERARRFTRKWPKQALGWNALGAAREGLGELAEAAQAYRRALKLEPGDFGAALNRGNVLRALGDAEAARAAYEQALAIAPDAMQARYNLGLALADLGRWQEAASAYRQTLEQTPDSADGHNQLGNALAALGELMEAEKAYRRATELAPERADFWSNTGSLLQRRGRLDAALAAHDRAVALAPETAGLRQNRGLCRRELLDFAGAEADYRAALAHAPNPDAARLPLAHVLKYQGRFDEAEALYRARIDAAPERADAHVDLADMLADLGRLDEAVVAYRQALQRDPDHGGALYGLAKNQRLTSDSADAALIRESFAAGASACGHYAMAKLGEDCGAPAAEIFAHYAAGATERRAGLDFDIECEEAELRAIAAGATAERIDAAAATGSDTGGPIFIVGMIRSGTTLVEQILASHPCVTAGDERADLVRQEQRACERHDCSAAELLAHLPADERAAMARGYMDTVRAALGEHDGPATDKLPANFKRVGLIAALFPGARVIHVRRDPVDTCLSCYTQLFGSGQAFSYDLTELGRYYRAYQTLMQHWREVLPAGRMLEIDYEAVIDDPAAETGRLLDYCGLEWADACLDFHRTARAVPTASSWQVRQPLYRTSVGRWRRYAEELQPLLAALGKTDSQAGNER